MSVESLTTSEEIDHLARQAADHTLSWCNELYQKLELTNRNEPQLFVTNLNGWLYEIQICPPEHIFPFLPWMSEGEVIMNKIQILYLPYFLCQRNLVHDSPSNIVLRYKLGGEPSTLEIQWTEGRNGSNLMLAKRVKYEFYNRDFLELLTFNFNSGFEIFKPSLGRIVESIIERPFHNIDINNVWGFFRFRPKVKYYLDLNYRNDERWGNLIFNFDGPNSFQGVHFIDTAPDGSPLNPEYIRNFHQPLPQDTLIPSLLPQKLVALS